MRRRTHLIALALLATVLPSPGGASATPRSLGPQAELARIASGDADPARTPALMVRALLELANAEPQASTDIVDPDWEEAWISGRPGGDLDGDGAEDAIEQTFYYAEGLTEDGSYEWVFESHASLVNGVTGADLWSIDGSSVYVPAGDLDGIGGDDLFAFKVTPLSVPATYAWAIEVSGVRGSDGTTLWTRAYANPFTFVESGPTYGYYDIDFAIPSDADHDLDGDGVNDVLMVRYAVAFTYDEATATEIGVVNALIETVSGRTGTPTGLSLEADRRWVAASVTPDMSGDGLADVLVASGAQDGTGTLAPRSARGPAAPLWTAPIGELEGFFWLDAADLDGDGRGDVLVQEVSFLDEFWFELGPQRVRAFSGLAGAPLWDVEVPTISNLEPVGRADGTPGADLLGIWERGWGPSSGDPMHAFLLAGTTGATTWTRTWSGFLRGSGAGDLNGDGVGDAVVSSRVTIKGKKMTRVRAISGAGGPRLWMRDLPKSSWVRTLGEDATGDGLADLIEVTWSGPSDRYRLRHGASGGAAWSGMRSPGRWLHDLALLGSGADAAILESGDTAPLKLTSAARSAADGALRWRRTTEF